MASNFEFYSPTRVIFGKGTEQRVGALVREYGGTRVLIVYGGKSAVRSGVLDRAENSLAEAGISSWTLGGVVPNPHLDKVYEGIRIGKENSIDFLLAVGGGSVIDTAKAIAYGLAEPEKDVWELYEHTRTARKCLPVASILTIAAAGSETSNSSVITRVDTQTIRQGILGQNEEVGLQTRIERLDHTERTGGLVRAHHAYGCTLNHAFDHGAPLTVRAVLNAHGNGIAIHDLALTAAHDLVVAVFGYNVGAMLMELHAPGQARTAFAAHRPALIASSTLMLVIAPHGAS